MTLTAKFKTTRTYTETLCAPLKTEDYVVQVVVFSSPVKWHIAHTTWFFEAFILRKFAENYIPFNDDFDFIFNSYYNNSGKRINRVDRGNLSRPSVDEVYAYRKHVDEAMIKFLSQNPQKEAQTLLELGINHEQQHQELLLTDIKYMFGHNPLLPVYHKERSLVNHKNQETGFAVIKEGVYEVGYKGNDFCYDNELNAHKVYLNDFEISKSLVTNGDFMEFMEAGGYQDFNLWLEEGLHWKEENKVNSPMYWQEIAGIWHQYTLAGLQEVDPDCLLTHISFYEAAAFAEWKSMRLPTEFEWEIASNKFEWGKRWEWTNSAYLPYPQFKKAAGAVGEYNGKFMDKQKVLRGASVATSKNHSRKSYRNFFYSEERWQYTGIRLVK
jgi:ergothioneine biosynthesis protein EgtB